MSFLFSPITIRSVTLKNRIVVSPMCQYSSVDGFANDWHLVHLGSRATGGAALVILEATAVCPEGRITPDDLGLWKDDHIDFLKRIVGFIESQQSIAGIQLAHAGRKASHESPWKGNAAITGEAAWTTVAPSPLPYKENEPVPAELSKIEIKKITGDFRDAAKRALAAGFKVIEIHAAHGYLLHEFLSPLSNKRNDEYAGSFENRCRILFEIVDAIRSVWPDSLPLFVRISATDWIENGWTEIDSVNLAVALKNKDVDLIDCSSGGNSPTAKIPVAPLYQLPFAEKIKKETGILTGAVGLITTAAQAENIIATGQADLVIMARQLLREPYFPLQAAKELGDDVDWPVQYERAKK
jgi:2,4-dienoyl-CoA reductase-like NADH-dependent reductase (Old Yellow Enzyme family)